MNKTIYSASGIALELHLRGYGDNTLNRKEADRKFIRLVKHAIDYGEYSKDSTFIFESTLGGTHRYISHIVEC